MDSTWMSLCRSSPAYKKGLDKFIERIFSKKGKDGHIYYPCIHCGNQKWVDRVQAKTYLLCDGFFEGYKIPTVFFEPDDTPMWDAEDDMQGLAQSVFHIFEDEDDDIGQTENQTVPNLNAEKFYKVLEDAKKELYPGCKFSVLSFIVRLFHSKCVRKCNEKGFSMILGTIREAFPHSSIPNSLYELRKVIRGLGLGYEKIDACPNDCELTTQADNDGDYEGKKSRTKDGILRHPADSPAWKTFDYQNSEFAKEPRNVRLGLASDGFNPLGNMGVSHSTWPDTGVNTYDASNKSNFTLRAGLIWTVSDFPGYANLSRWSTKGKLACPACHKLTRSIRLSNSQKDIFMAHRRWLELLHAFRMDKDSFDGTKEHEGRLRCLTREHVLAELKDGKTKDHLRRRDLEEMGIRHELHQQPLSNGKVYLPYACFLMDKKEKETFCDVPKSVKVPDGYAANISRCIQGKPPKITGLKSHDNHILMLQLLPVAIRNILPKHVRSVIMKLCWYYRKLCSKVLKPTDIFKMEKDIGKILCDLERIFSPSFFDVMIHLTVHQASEARLGGSVHYHWMYPIERYLASDVETIHNKTSRNHDDGGDETILPIFCMAGGPIGTTNVVKLGYDILAIAHSHVLFNCSKIDFLRIEHLNILSHQNQNKRKRDIQRLHSQEFEEWLSDYVDEDMASCGDNRITSDIKTSAIGPNEVVKKYKGYIINGFRFHIKDVEKYRTTQNSGVILQALTSSFSSARDNDPIVGDVTYYCVLNDIIELRYGDDKKIVLFHCDWISSGSRIKVDENGFTTLDFRGLKQTKEPYILASQAQQVFYVADPARKDWKVVIKTTPRDNFDMDEQICIDDVETHFHSDTLMGPQLVENENIDMVRDDLNGNIVDDDTLVAATDKNQIDDHDAS
ncbi:uncharacterized protein [Rutidosis leptorrhynchoides]|uniref:uncharacterized protein n=1 Tax=Rutidosis leptorrhynchoides TaxID=125765 RepID=UPI003A9A0145